MKLYHGSNIAVKTPEIMPTQRTLDFGGGFYTTLNFEQAAEFAKKVVLRSKKFGLTEGIATVSEYEYNFETAEKTLRVLNFDEPDKAWLEFVVGNRQGKNFDKGYDLVAGPVANDNVYTVIGYYEDGSFTEEMAISALKIKKLFTQIVLKTDKALALLKFAKSAKI
ncbi:MAG: DUF3990 domain-containing protein [Elusimicrobiota bacterium]|jgi:hypothetical protein|nr:DUF3990 domain-containing protein [Elusimicrobiota bacterium]